MTLHRKTLLLLGATFFCLIALIYITSEVIMLKGLIRLEEQETRKNVERFMDALSNEIAKLHMVVHDWAAWDDTYAFIDDTNEAFIKKNLSDEVFSVLKINLILFVDTAGNVIFKKAVDLEGRIETDFPEGIYEHINNKFIVNHLDIMSSISGIILLENSPVLISSHPVLTSEQKGPSKGTLIMGRYLDKKVVEDISKITHLSLHICPFNDMDLPEGFYVSLSEERPVSVQRIKKDIVTGYALLRDIYGRPAIIARIDMPRDIYKQGKISLRYFIISLLVISCAFMFVTLILIEKQVLARLAFLTENVIKFRASDGVSNEIILEGKDELADLAHEIKEMLEAQRRYKDALIKSHDDLEEQVQQRTSELTRSNEVLQREITERKKADETIRENQRELQRSEKSLKEFSRKLLSVREEEKKNISTTLHDEVGSMTVVLSSHLSIAEEEIRERHWDEAIKCIQQTRLALKNAASNLRNIAIDLRPPNIEIIGLYQSLADYLSSLEEKAKIKIDFETNIQSKGVDGISAITIYRLVQEASNNIVRHSKAKTAKIRLYLTEDAIKLNVCDDGQGFDLKEAFYNEEKPLKIGILGMRERVESLGGIFIMHSHPGKGTEIDVTLPFHHDNVQR